MSSPSRPRVLALRALGLGDLCTAVPALRALRAAFGDHRLLLAAPGWQLPLARLAGVDEVVDHEGLAPLPTSLRGVEVAVNLHGRGPESSGRLDELDPGRLVAFRHDAVPATRGGPSWDGDEHEVRRWCRLLDHAGVPADPTDLLLEPPSGASVVAPGGAVVHPGAAAPSRRWPADRFARVVRWLLAQGHPVALTGSRSEEALCRRVVRLAGADRSTAVQVLAGRTTVEQLAATVAGAAMVVCNDTGIAHLATAHRTPSVVVFGPTPPSRWGPPASGPHRALWAGRVGDPHGRDVDPGLLDIGVGDVIDALVALRGSSERVLA